MTILSKLNLWPGQMRLADFNGDGNLDLLTSHFNADLGITPEPLQIFLGDGTGGLVWQTDSVFSTGIPYTNFVPRIFTADFNNDQISDIFAPDFGHDAVPFTGGQNSLFLSSAKTKTLADFRATLPQALRQNHGTSIGDINGDGYLDILVNALNDSTGSANDVLINDGYGKFTSTPNLLPSSLSLSKYEPGYTSSLLKDLNNDGLVDMVLGTWDVNSKPSQIYLNTGGGFSKSNPISLPRSNVPKEIILDIQTLDLNGDDLPDLALSVTNGSDNFSYGNNAYQVSYIQLLVNLGGGSFIDETQFRLPQSIEPAKHANWYLSVTPVDINHDGFFDLITDNGGGETAKIFVNDGIGQFNEVWTDSNRLAIGDINNDGMDELVVTYGYNYKVVSNPFVNHHIYKGGFGGDTLLGSQSNDLFFSSTGDSAIDGRGGIDTAIYRMPEDNYLIGSIAKTFTVSKNSVLGGTDSLINVERLHFTDKKVALDVTDNALETLQFLGVIAPSLQSNLNVRGTILSLFDQGKSMQEMSQLALDVGLITSDNTALAKKVFKNVFNTTADPDQNLTNTLVNFIEQNGDAKFLATVAGLNINVDLVGLQQHGMEFI